MRRAALGVVLVLLGAALTFGADGPYQSEPTKRKPRRLAVPRPSPSPSPTPTPAPVEPVPYGYPPPEHVAPCPDASDYPCEPDPPITTTAAAPAATVEEPADNPAVEIDILAGAQAAMGSESGTGLVPFARVGVAVPLAQRDRAPRLLAQIDLTSAPGQTVNLADAATFRAVEVKLGLSQPLHKVLNFTIYAEGGFTTRLPGDVEPRDRTVRWANVGVMVGRYARGHLAVGVGVDERLSGRYLPAVVMAGAIELWKGEEGGTLAGASVQLVGEAVLNLELLPAGRSDGRADLVRVGIAVGR